MRSVQANVPALAAVLLLFVGSARIEAQDSGIPVGTKAPPATVETLAGKPFALDSIAGRGKTPVVLQFWATWCANCRQLEPAMRAARRKYGSRVRFVGIAVSVNQSPERVRRYQAKHALPLEIFYDRSGAATEAYEVPATSFVVVLDAKGTVVYTGVGGEQDIDAAIRKAL